MIEGGRSELLEKLSDNLLDIVILLQNSALEKSFSSIVISNMQLVCFASYDHPIAKESFVTPEILKNTPLVLFENSFFQTEKIKKWFSDENIEPNIIMQTKQLSTLLAMISQNAACGFAFEEIAKTNKNLVAIPCKVPLSADVSLVWNKDAYNFDSMEKFKTFIKENNPFLTI